MDGVIRIGAVNCGDNNHLCRRNGITSYPSLFIYRAGQVRIDFILFKNGFTVDVAVSD